MVFISVEMVFISIVSAFISTRMVFISIRMILNRITDGFHLYRDDFKINHVFGHIRLFFAKKGLMYDAFVPAQKASLSLSVEPPERMLRRSCRSEPFGFCFF
jgi:hypothetical protein